MKLIGFSGKMGSGKSTAIQCLKELQHNPVRLVKFAQPLYDMQEYIYNKIEPTYKRPFDFIKDRKLLQWLGTEWGRGTISDTLWVDIWKEEMQYLSEYYPNYILVSDDVRFDNEADAVKSLGGSIVLIQSNKNQERIDVKAGISGHASESGIDLEKVDYMIDNNGTIEDLKSSLLTFNSIKALW